MLKRGVDDEVGQCNAEDGQLLFKAQGDHNSTHKRGNKYLRPYITVERMIPLHKINPLIVSVAMQIFSTQILFLCSLLSLLSKLSVSFIFKM